jgi:hypothetical protein
MNRLNVTRLLPRLALASGLLASAALVGCGGGDDAASIIQQALDSKAPNLAVAVPGTGTAAITAIVQPAWASLAMFVPPGQASFNVPVKECGIDNPTVNKNTRRSVLGTPLYTASFVIMASGEAIFSAATSSTGTVSDLLRVRPEFIDNSTIRAELSNGSDQVVLVNTFEDTNGDNARRIKIDQPDGSTEYLAEFIASSVSGGGATYKCNLSLGSLAMRIPPSAARLLEKFVPTAAQLAGRSNYTYDNLALNSKLENNQVNSRYADLNLNTGILSTASKNSTATSDLTPVALQFSSSTQGGYQEIYRKVTKTIGVQVQTTTVSREFEFASTSADTGALFFQMKNQDGQLSHTARLGTLITVP